ncbi:MAG: hypothetical protein ACREQ4_04350 [Candidatus Binataceae bacterium]
MMVKFPSTDYFDALKLRMQAEGERFRRLGFIDTTFGLVVGGHDGSRSFVLTFEVFELKDAREVARIDLPAVDFVIEGDAAVWRDMLDNIRRHGEADTAHDINTLTHFGEALRVTYDSPDGHDKLYRFMESIQEFFDLSSQVEVSF